MLNFEEGARALKGIAPLLRNCAALLSSMGSCGCEEVNTPQGPCPTKTQHGVGQFG